MSSIRVYCRLMTADPEDMPSRELPNEAQMIAYHDQLSNWGRWGPDDERGTLNLITEEHRRRAAGLVRDGVTVSMSLDIEPTPPRMPDQTDVFGPVQRFMLRTGEGLNDPDRVAPRRRWGGNVEHVGLVFHGHSITHFDALSHLHWDRRSYNDVPAEHVTITGATKLDVRAASEGVVTRGILVDVPHVRRVAHLDAGQPVLPEDLEAAERELGFEIGPGDAVFLRTGYRESSHAEDTGAQPGWHVSCLPWMRERDVALAGSDVDNDVRPSGYDVCDLPFHFVAIVAMGMPLVDNCWLLDLSNACAARNRWEFMFVLAPLRIQGGTGSPTNPLAIL
jgi:kynurenine formamidase